MNAWTKYVQEAQELVPEPTQDEIDSVAMSLGVAEKGSLHGAEIDEAKLKYAKQAYAAIRGLDASRIRNGFNPKYPIPEKGNWFSKFFA